MIQLHFGVKQLKIGKTISVLHSFVCNYVKYANMEGFCRDSVKMVSEIQYLLAFVRHKSGILAESYGRINIKKCISTVLYRLLKR